MREFTALAEEGLWAHSAGAVAGCLIYTLLFEFFLLFLTTRMPRSRIMNNREP